MCEFSFTISIQRYLNKTKLTAFIDNVVRLTLDIGCIVSQVEYMDFDQPYLT